MNWLDFVLLIILAWSVVTSFRKGLSREIIGLVSVVLGLLLASWFYGTAGSYLLPYVSSRHAANLAGFFLVFCTIVIIGGVFSAVLGKFLRVTGLSFFDHVLGAGFGMVRGVLVAAALVLGIMAFSEAQRPPAALVNSRMAPYVMDTARIFAAVAPHEVKEGFHNSYAQVKTAWNAALKKGIRHRLDTDKDENEK